MGLLAHRELWFSPCSRPLDLATCIPSLVRARRKSDSNAGHRTPSAGLTDATNYVFMGARRTAV